MLLGKQGNQGSFLLLFVKLSQACILLYNNTSNQKQEAKQISYVLTSKVVRPLIRSNEAGNYSILVFILKNFSEQDSEAKHVKN